jgi:uncharacterized protein (TIGR02145 family)
MFSRISISRLAVPLGFTASVLCISACSDDSGTSASENGSTNSGTIKEVFHGQSPVPKIVPAGTYDCSEHKCVYDAYLNPDVTYGEFLDERDDHVYKTLEIGGHIWLAQNLVFKTKSGRVSSMYNSSSYVLKSGYDYDVTAAADTLRTNCGDTLSRENCNWDERGICPLGFHMPTSREAHELLNEFKSEENINIFDSKNPTGFISGTSDGSNIHFWYWATNHWEQIWCQKSCSDWTLSHFRSAAIRCVADTVPRQFTSGSYVSTLNAEPDTASDLNRIASEMEVDWEYGELKDERDGKVYKTITFQGREWMAENLNYDSPIKNGDFCLNDIEENCDIYGRYYTWSVAMDSAKTGCGMGVKCAPGDTVQGICPDGWRLPVYNDLLVFEENYYYNLSCASSWSSYYPSEEGFRKYHCNTYGFAMPANGLRMAPGIYSFMTTGNIILAQERDEENAYVGRFTTYQRPSSYNIYKWQAAAVRCIKKF